MNMCEVFYYHICTIVFDRWIVTEITGKCCSEVVQANLSWATKNKNIEVKNQITVAGNKLSKE